MSDDTPTRWRKKPVAIEALRYDDQNVAAMHDFVGDAASWRGGVLHILTLEGAMKVNRGDYVIKGVAGEFYPCKPDIFVATYEAVHDE